MLFNSTIFLFGFLPVVLAGFFVLGRTSPSLAALWLAAASFVFYGWWNPLFIPLLGVSAFVNFHVGVHLAQRRAAGRETGLLLEAGVAFNLILLGYFKYTNFFASLAGLGPYDITLPIGISFFTFTQIAFLVDASHGAAREYKTVHYGLFVSYFPHLVAGPILHHREMMPQFDNPKIYRPQWENFAVGLSILSIGLFKKVVIADSLAPHAHAAFGAADAGHAVSLFQAWSGALCYTFQLYFDFSGYSDMAIGLSRLFGVKLPVNFDSPYKAANIAEFWRRWHMTLSRFLRDYLYIPLGGSRHGRARMYLSLFMTMVLGGLWHGAGATFIVWGALHGAYLALHRAFSGSRLGGLWRSAGAWGQGASMILTFVCVVVAWVFFRAESLQGALRFLHGMTGLDGKGSAPLNVLVMIGVVAAAVWLLPNTQQVLARFDPGIPVYRPIEPPANTAFAWRPAMPWLALSVILGWAALARLFAGRESPFLYFNF